MSQELIDLRAKITPEAHAALEAERRTTGADISEIVRGILHGWALQKIDAASVLHKLLLAEGLAGISHGNTGNRRDNQG